MILIVNSNVKQVQDQQTLTANQILFGTNKTMVIANKTAFLIGGNNTEKPVVNTLENVKELLTSINKTLANPNRTIHTEAANALRDLNISAKNVTVVK